MADMDDRPQLQRRGGRRISMPSSPISPSLPKRYDRFYRSPDIINSIDAHATDTPIDPPSNDLQFSSSLFSDSNLAFNNGGDGSARMSTVHMVATEESDRNRNMDQGNNTRASTLSSRGSESRQSQPMRPPFLSDMVNKNSPVMGRTSEGRERNFETSVAGGRNYSTTSLSTDRSASDENIPTKQSTTTATTTKKSRLTLLNPMSIINRRRSSQNPKLEEMNLNISPVPAMPDFDPSIRGSFVHDFTTPRYKRSHFENSPRPESISSPVNLRRPSDFGTSGAPYGSSASPALHSPMFREHFQDDDKALQPGQTAYLHNVANSRKSFGAPPPASLPSFAQKLPATLPGSDRVSRQKELPPIYIPHPENPPPPPPKVTPPPTSTSPSEPGLVAANALPKHMTSVSSRFSFQIAGQDSAAQEKLLEDKHKEHFAKDPNKPGKDEEAIDDDYDDYDFDADDDLEERIPGVNTAFDEDDGFDNDDIPTRNIEMPSSHHQPAVSEPLLHGFHFTPTDTAFSPTTTYHVSEPTPRDTDGFAIGIADSKDSPVSMLYGHTPKKLSQDTVPQLFLEGLRISTVNQNQSPLRESAVPVSDSQQAFDDLDLYFDDGEFDMDHIDPDNHFDESLLDDESSHIRDIPAENAKRYEAALERSVPGDRIAAVDPNTIGISRDTSSSSNFVNIHGADSSDFLSSREAEQNGFIPNHTPGLTEGNLAAYHDALAEAANYAAANGKFNRQISFGSDISNDVGQNATHEVQTIATTGDGHSQNDANSEYVDDYETFTFDDDAMDDDLMIAEANAEALENDDDGFYGQEFGFYARAHGKSISEYVNGGFFTARGSNGVKRSHSGKVNFQEPSLTPITERSEWSPRTSVASLIPFATQSLSSPDINQLLNQTAFEDDMTLSALIKLRRSAFGGSSTSINSMGDRSMPGSSPLAHPSSYSFPPQDGSHTNRPNNGTSTAIVEPDDDDDLEAEQLTLTQNTPRKLVPGAIPATPQGHTGHLAVTEPSGTARKGYHRRNSSGADSVSYVRDKDGHWVLERRRTGDDGEQEIVEREYLAGARI